MVANSLLQFFQLHRYWTDTASFAVLQHTLYSNSFQCRINSLSCRQFELSIAKTDRVLCLSWTQGNSYLFTGKKGKEHSENVFLHLFMNVIYYLQYISSCTLSQYTGPNVLDCFLTHKILCFKTGCKNCWIELEHVSYLYQIFFGLTRV